MELRDERMKTSKTAIIGDMQLLRPKRESGDRRRK